MRAGRHSVGLSTPARPSWYGGQIRERHGYIATATIIKEGYDRDDHSNPGAPFLSA